MGYRVPFLRSVVLKLMPPSWRADAERDSLMWLTECTRCGNISNFWELSGIRWRAAGQPLTRMRCIAGDRFAMQRVHKP